MAKGGLKPIKDKVDISCPTAVRRWYQSIGSKGGQAGKGTERRREVGRISAKKRWAKIKAAGGINWSKPKGRPKKKRPQAKPPKRKNIGLKGDEVLKSKMAFGPKVPMQIVSNDEAFPPIGFK
jgi:hypothetical protein